MDFQIDYVNPETAVLRLSGRFDTSALGSLKTDLIAGEALRYVIADMSRTSFMDSLGLATLVSILKAMRARGGDFYIVNPTDVVRLLLELTRMDSAFHIVGDVDIALHRIQDTARRFVITRLPSRLVASNAPEYRATIRGELEKGATRLILDATQTEFIDSSGLGVLVSAYKAMTEKGGRLALVGLQNRARQVFEVSRMDIVFTLYPTLPEALAALEG